MSTIFSPRLHHQITRNQILVRHLPWLLVEVVLANGCQSFQWWDGLKYFMHGKHDWQCHGQTPSNIPISLKINFVYLVSGFLVTSWLAAYQMHINEGHVLQRALAFRQQYDCIWCWHSYESVLREDFKIISTSSVFIPLPYPPQTFNHISGKYFSI